MVQKKYPTIGCCGIDCGLCPRYYTEGPSRCPGCCGPDFSDKHPSCSFITCCVKGKDLEACAECKEFPCSKFDTEGKYDSFVTHGKARANLDFIKKRGVKEFLEQQKKRIALLKIMLKEFDDGRSKSFYCLAAALLPIDDLEKSIETVKKESAKDDKRKSRILKQILDDLAQKKGIELRLRKPG